MAVPSGPVSASTDAEGAMFDFVDAYDRAYEVAAEEHGMTAAQACVLGRISMPRGMRELADELGCEASNITQIVSRLEVRGLVRRHAHPDDRRSRQLVRTGAGDALNAAFEKTFGFARTAASTLSIREQAQLTGLLRKALGQSMSHE